jgi:hypothetical protein
LSTRLRLVPILGTPGSTSVRSNIISTLPTVFTHNSTATFLLSLTINYISISSLHLIGSVCPRCVPLLHRFRFPRLLRPTPMMSGWVYPRSTSSFLVPAKCCLLPITRPLNTLPSSLIMIKGTVLMPSPRRSPTPGLPGSGFSMPMITGLRVISNVVGSSSLTLSVGFPIRTVNRLGSALGECDAPWPVHRHCWSFALICSPFSEFFPYLPSVL